MWETVAVVILVVGCLCWLLVGRRGQISFWNQALRQPDTAYDFFDSAEVWQVFDEGLPANFREVVPTKEWIGPFPMVVPKLGDQQVFVFGRKGEFRQSQVELLSLLRQQRAEETGDQSQS